jgi:DNA topoisomerase-2
LGGTHVDAWIEATLRPIVQKLTSPSGISFTIGDVKKFFKIFVVVMVINPEFESQSKHKLESPVKASVSKKDITTILGWSVIDDIKRSKELGALKKLERKKKNFVKIEGLDPANNEGSKLGHQCTLILVEGLAAKTYAVKGIDVGAFGKKGRDWFGIYALRGKVLNVRNAKTASIAKNNVIADIIKALGAQIGFNYKETEKFMSLRYGKILIITDADVDGIHISGLLQNMVHTLFP